ncbi:HET-domain-containing protein [Thozetella sp. PMI_491]|nr:HET-domain-containing protein [Thozetella sp. PMI_491]
MQFLPLKAVKDEMKQIRLLRVLPGTSADEIQCELETVSLVEDYPPFEALSYVWGDAEDKPTVLMDGEIAHVTRNLEKALRRLRHHNRPRLLWADAVCINQDDKEERTSQVRLMGSIYSMADSVVISMSYMPMSPETGAELLRIMHILADNPALHWADPALPALAGGSALGTLILFDMMFLLHDPWWTRIWTVQEIVLAKRNIFIFGDGYEVPGDVMERFCRSIIVHTGVWKCCSKILRSEDGIILHNDVAWPAGFANLIFGLRRRRAKHTNFMDISSRFRLREATDPRDKLAVDYRLSYAEVHEATTRELPRSSGSLDALSHIIRPIVDSKEPGTERGTRSLGYSLPAWIPNWNWNDKVDRRFKPALTAAADANSYTIRCLPLFNACGGTPFIPINDMVAGGELRTPIVFHDKVTRLSRTYGTQSPGSGFQTQVLLAQIPEWREMAGIELHPARPYVGGGGGSDTVPISDAFWRTLCWDANIWMSNEGYNGRFDDDDDDDNGQMRNITRVSKDKRICYEKWWIQHLLSKYNLPPPPEVPGGYGGQEVIFFQLHVLRMTFEHRFFLSEKGYMGPAPRDAEAGDDICVLPGGKMPLILRSPGSNETGHDAELSALPVRCRLVGDTYVHGLMDGEAVLGKEPRFEQGILV